MLTILQYRVGPKQRKSKRIPLNHVAEIEHLLKDGDGFKAFMARYGAGRWNTSKSAHGPWRIRMSPALGRRWASPCRLDISLKWGYPLCKRKRTEPFRA